MKDNINNTKSKARSLRALGYTLTEISEKLNVAKTTIQSWVKDIKLTKGQKQRIEYKILNSGKKGRKLALKINKSKLDFWKREIIKKAVFYTRQFKKDTRILKLICGILYICEGAKYPATRFLAFSNSDPRVIRLFLVSFRKSFTIDESKFRCRIMHRYDQDSQELNKYWSKITKIPLYKFYPSYADKRTKNFRTKKVGYKGICAVYYLDSSVQFLLQSIGESLLD